MFCIAVFFQNWWKITHCFWTFSSFLDFFEFMYFVFKMAIKNHLHLFLLEFCHLFWTWVKISRPACPPIRSLLACYFRSKSDLMSNLNFLNFFSDFRKVLNVFRITTERILIWYNTQSIQIINQGTWFCVMLWFVFSCFKWPSVLIIYQLT